MEVLALPSGIQEETELHLADRYGQGLTTVDLQQSWRTATVAANGLQILRGRLYEPSQSEELKARVTAFISIRTFSINSAGTYSSCRELQRLAMAFVDFFLSAPFLTILASLTWSSAFATGRED